MVCIYCHSDTKVTNSRAKAKTPSVWRRRLCQSCVAQFSTLEVPDYAGSLSVREDIKYFTPFSRDKLFISLHQALGHRPTAVNDASALASTVIGKILQSPRLVEGIITKRHIAETSFAVLKRFDPLAATTYKAYHQAVL